jgi:hypothetical protein
MEQDITSCLKNAGNSYERGIVSSEGCGLKIGTQVYFLELKRDCGVNCNYKNVLFGELSATFYCMNPSVIASGLAAIRACEEACKQVETSRYLPILTAN